jgi:hypothetical protein
MSLLTASRGCGDDVPVYFFDNRLWLQWHWWVKPSSAESTLKEEKTNEYA